MTRAKVELEFAGVRWTVKDIDVSSTKWASEVPVGDYGVYGLGVSGRSSRPAPGTGSSARRRR
jgi:hypothetical protein